MATAKKQATSKQSALANQEQCTQLYSPKALMEFSNSIKSIIIDNGLYSEIKGKNFINVEGWQMAGAFLGIIPIVESSERDINCEDGEIKYRAKVNLMRGAEHVGTGFATCSNLEHSKRSFDEYAIESMAQTRAISKAYRTTIGFLLKMAGYEATPAEEIVDVDIEVEQPAKPAKPAKKQAAKKQDDPKAKTIDHIRMLYKKCLAEGVSESDLTDVVGQFTPDIKDLPKLDHTELLTIMAAFDGLFLNKFKENEGNNKEKGN